MTYTVGNNNTSVLSFNSTSATQQTLTFGGKSTSQLQFATAGNWIFSDAWTGLATNTVLTHTAGTVNTNGQTITCGVLSSSNSNVRTLTLGASSVTCTSAGASWTFATSTNLTFNANTSTVTLNGASITFNGGGMAFNNLIVSGSGAAIITGGGTTVVNLTRTGTAVKTDSMQLNTDYIISGTFTVTGNSATNRLIVLTNTVGVSRTITAAVTSLTNVDFMDITGAGAASPFTGTSLGDALGNSGITFDAPATNYMRGAGSGNWSDQTRWSSTVGGAGGSGRVPLPQDAVIFDATSAVATHTNDMPRMGADITFTGFTGVFANSVSTSFFGSLTFASGMVLSGTSAFTCRGRSSHTITSAGIFFLGGFTTDAPGGTYTLQDAYTNTGNTNTTLTNGTFTANNFNVSLAGSNAFTAAAGTTVNMGSGTWSFSRTAAATIFSATATTTITGLATILIATASTADRTFAGGGKTYGTLTYTVDNSPGILIVTGANTFTTINVDSGKILQLPSATTTTVSNFNVNGAVNEYVYLPGVAANYASAPDSAALSITGDLTMDIKVALDDWTPAANSTLLGKWLTSGGQRGYVLQVNTTGVLNFFADADGSAADVNVVSTVATGVTDGAVKWVRVSFDVDNGASGNDVKFYLSDDGVAWTQLGTTVTTAGVTSIFDSTALFEIGTQSTGATNPATGKFYQAKVYNSYLQTSAGTPVFNADFTTKTVGANSFTESSSNAATVTINGDLAKVGDGRVSLVSSSGGSAATLTSASQQSVSYLSIQDSTVDASPKWYAGATSTNVSGNTNWLFVTAPSAGSGSGGVQSKKALQNLQHL